MPFAKFCAGCRIESAQINLSLFMLGNVVARLAQGRKRAWLPFRNSKLTRLLQNALGGNARSVVIATIHPGVAHAEETASTLRFASRAMQVENAYTVNEQLSSSRQLQEMSKDVDTLMGPLQARKIADLQQQLVQLQSEV
jgi:centromeric protein E